MIRLKDSLSRIYRHLSPTRRVLARLEDQMAHLERLIVDGNQHNLHIIQDHHSESRAHLDKVESRLSCNLQPLARMNEIENLLLRRFDEQLLELKRIQLTGTKQLEHIWAELKGEMRPISDVEAFQNSVLRRFDEQLFELNRLHAEATVRFENFESQLNEGIFQLETREWALQLRDGVSQISNGIVDIKADLSTTKKEAAYETQLLSELLSDLKKELSVVETSLSRTLQAHLDKTRVDVTHKMDSVANTMQAVSDEATAANKRKSQELQTILSLQEHLVSTGFNLTSGPKDLPDLRKIAMALENGEAVLDPNQHSVAFMGHPLAFDDLFSVYVVYKEIYLYEDYYAELGTDTPRIIDGRAHIGMSALYFKDRYPSAEVLCFEPDPRNFELLTKNTAHIPSGVSLYNLAITNDGADYPLMRRQGQSMASSIYSRYSKINNDDGLVTKSVKLSTFLVDQVDLLKLDIEGPEDLVLEECKHLLQNVHYLFIEFHTGDNLPLSRLTKILSVLDESCFTYQIERAREYQIRMLHRPFTHLNHLCTHVIHAKNRKFGK